MEYVNLCNELTYHWLWDSASRSNYEEIKKVENNSLNLRKEWVDLQKC